MTELRLGHADREAAAAELGEHFAQGRLSKEELDERTDAVWSARVRSDLAPLFADLPGAGGPGAGGPDVRVAGSPEPRWRGGWVPPRHLVRVVLGVVLVVAVLTHLPFLLLVGGLWFYLSRRHGVGVPPWVGRGHRGPRGGIRPPA